MAENPYDAVKDRIRRQFSRSKTYEPDSDGIVFDTNDHNFVGNDNFLNHGPFNHVYIENTTSSDITAYSRSNRESKVVIPAGESVQLTEVVAQRYVGFLRLEGVTGQISVQVGTNIDSTEVDLLKMTGQLNIEQ